MRKGIKKSVSGILSGLLLLTLLQTGVTVQAETGDTGVQPNNTPVSYTENTGDFTVTGGTYGTDYEYDENRDVLTIKTNTELTITTNGNPTSGMIWGQGPDEFNIVLQDVYLTGTKNDTHINFFGNLNLTISGTNKIDVTGYGLECVNLTITSASTGSLVLAGTGMGLSVGGDYSIGNLTVNGGTLAYNRAEISGTTTVTAPGTIKQIAPAPSLSISDVERTKNSLTVQGTFDTDTYGNVEYQWDGGTWGASASLSGLTADSGHSVAVRYQGNDIYWQSDASSTVSVSTLKDGSTLIAEPSELKGTYGQRLSDVSLPEGWSWENSSTALTVGASSYPAVFNTVKHEADDYDFTGIAGYDATSQQVNRNLTIAVEKADSTIKIKIENIDKDYDGQPVELSIDNVEIMGTTSTNITFEWYQKDTDGQWQIMSSAPKNVGEYRVVAKVASDNNYDGASSAPLNFSISQATNNWTKNLSITGWIIGQYDESVNAPKAETKFGDISFSYSGQENGVYTEAVPTEAGTWYVKATVMETDNYKGLEAIVSFEIKKASNSVSVTGATGLSILGSGTQEVALGSAISDITVTADDGYYFPTDYSVASSNGISVTRDSYTQLTISGTPTADVAIKLTAATAKSERAAPNVRGGVGSAINGTDTTMEYAASETSDTWTACTDGSTTTGAGTWYVRYKETDTQKASAAVKVEVIEPTYTISVNETALTFDTKNEGYASVTGQSVTITNTGNSKVTFVTPTSSNYDVTLSGSELDPSGTATLTVTPKASLTAGEYNETLEVKTTENTSVNVSVSFKVNGALSVSLGSSASEIIEGQSATLTATVNGGSGEYAYTWYADDVEDTSLKGNEVTVTPNVTTTYKVVVRDTIEDKSATATITVIPKKYGLTVSGDITFDSQHIGYTDAGTKSITVRNTGNVDVTNISASLAGASADAFTLDTTGTQTTLAPSATTSLSVTPKAELATGTYEVQVQITGDVGISETVDVTFTVSDHEYKETVTPPTCTGMGYTTHTCEGCGHSFTDSETAMLGHDFGEWKVTKEATETENGEKVRKCSRCSVEEKEVIPMLAKEQDKENTDKDDSDKDKSDKENTDEQKAAVTGDTDTTALWAALAMIASLSVAGALVVRRRKRHF